MIPRTVQMAKEVSVQLTSAQEIDLGNIIDNGYITVVPNTINKKAWQYAETTTPSVNLPSLATYTPRLKGWTTNYQGYYTHLQPNGYGVNPGDPTMFEYTVHSFEPLVGPIVVTGVVTYGEDYTLNDYFGVATTTNGIGVGATVDFSVDSDGFIASYSLASPGTGYAYGDVIIPVPVGQGGTEPIVFHVTEIDPVSGGASKWAQAPRRFNSFQVSDFVPPNENQQAISYSFLYPVADNPVAPPIGTLT